MADTNNLDFQEQALRWNQPNWASSTVSTTAVNIDAILAPVDFQQATVITNTHASNDLFVGWDSTVSSSKFAFKVAAGEALTIQISKDVDVFVIASGAGTTVVVSRCP